MTAASILAGLSSLGSDNMEMTEIKICSTPRIGLHRSSALSCEFMASSPGGCRIEMHTRPSGKMLGCHISDKKVMVGGMFGKSVGNTSRALKKPPSNSVSSGPRHEQFPSVHVAIVCETNGYQIHWIFAEFIQLSSQQLGSIIGHVVIRIEITLLPLLLLLTDGVWRLQSVVLVVLLVLLWL